MKKLLSFALALILLLGMAMPSLVPTAAAADDADADADAAAADYLGTMYPISDNFVLDGKITSADEWGEPFAVHTHPDGQVVEYYYAWDDDYCYTAVRWISAAEKKALLTLRSDREDLNFWIDDIGYYGGNNFDGTRVIKGVDWNYAESSGADGYEHMFEVQVPWSYYNKVDNTVKVLVEWAVNDAEVLASNGEATSNRNLHTLTLATAEGGETPVETDPVETDPVETEPVETEPVETEPVETEPVVPEYLGTMYPASETLELDGKMTSADEWGEPFAVHTHPDGQEVEYYYAWDENYCYVAVRWISAAEKEALLTLRSDVKIWIDDIGHYKGTTYGSTLIEGENWYYSASAGADGYEHMYEVAIPWSYYNKTGNTVKLLVEWFASESEHMASNGETVYSKNLHTFTLSGEGGDTQAPATFDAFVIAAVVAVASAAGIVVSKKRR